MTAYTMMLEEKYCDGMGVLIATYPSFYQFRYDKKDAKLLYFQRRIEEIPEE